MSASTPSLPFNLSANLKSSPFAGVIQASAMGWLPDALSVSFQCTQNMLNAAGKLYAAVFY